ncbi:1-acyl-sn-glycerol-3-phosphate acyltransferase [Rickettsiales bacterium]|nr:1-acyl-sn-glycerol-3-phosphate acyltransferase [Rickettsiales bacterium]
MKLTRWILLIDYEIEGKENIPDKPFIIASNHQSAWETFFFPIIFTRSVFILKKSLKKIPIFRSYFKKLGFIYVDKNNSFSSIKFLLKSASERINQGVYSIIIFPEGTRVRPGEEKELSSGISAIYSSLSIPVLPIKLDSGKFWLNKKFIKKRGKISVKIKEPIMPGLDKETFMKILKEKF